MFVLFLNGVTYCDRAVYRTRCVHHSDQGTPSSRSTERKFIRLLGKDTALQLVATCLKMQPYDEEQLEFCQALPKVELHAHLNGSLRDTTVRCVVIPQLQCCAAPILRKKPWPADG